MADDPKPPARAVALRYERGVDNAPEVLAVGRGEVAERIIQIARQSDVPLVQDQPVAEALSRLDVGQEIPVELYRAVAEILAFVYRLKDTRQ